MKKNLKILFTIISIFAISYILLNVKITKVEVEGLTRYTEVEFLSKVFKDKKDNISIVFFVKNLFKNEDEIVYINDYDIKWITPFYIIIDVKENDIIGFIKKDLSNVYFDSKGYIIEYSDERKYGAVEIRGVNFKSYNRGDKIYVEDEKIIRDIIKMSNYFKENNLEASLLEIKENDEVIIYIKEIKIFFGSRVNIDLKLQRLSEIFPQISNLRGELDLSNARDKGEDEFIFRKTY